ncbi:hypothetical protein [Streptomyces sp. NPDC127038]|uniref:hypothetical protein n=1 Tax=Streptomyces sp. NPDC127038 TaxID=3347114 RepID=UPI003667EA5A
MTDTASTASALSVHRRTFPQDPGRWEAEGSRAPRASRRGGNNSPGIRPALVHESTRWGWLAWPVSANGSVPDQPLRIGILIPKATRWHCLALRWLTRHPVHRISIAPGFRVRAAVAITTLACLPAALFAARYGLPWEVALPTLVLTPIVAEHLAAQMDARAGGYVRTVDGEASVRYLHRLTSMQTVLDQAADGSDCYQLLRSAQVGQDMLWDAAGLLQDPDTHAVSAALIARERLMVQLVDQVTSIRTRLSRTPAAGQGRGPGQSPLGPNSPGHRTATYPTRHDPHATTLRKRALGMPRTRPQERTTDVYLLFAHEPYFPDQGIQEVNTTVVTAETLLHPQVRQPDGARIHDLLTRGRERGAIVPLSTITHELGGGTKWPEVGDFERVTRDLVVLMQRELCHGLCLRLPELDRALVCIGPAAGQEVRIFDTEAGDFVAYGQRDRAEVLAAVGRILRAVKAERPLWPGEDLRRPSTALAVDSGSRTRPLPWRG